MELDLGNLNRSGFGDLVHLLDYCLGNRADKPDDALGEYMTTDRSVLKEYFQILEQMVVPPGPAPKLLPMPPVPRSAVPVPDMDQVLKFVVNLHKLEYQRRADKFAIQSANLQSAGLLEELAAAKQKFLRWKINHDSVNLEKAAKKKLRQLEEEAQTKREVLRVQREREVSSVTSQNNALLARYALKVRNYRQSVRGRIVERLRRELDDNGGSTRIRLTGRLPWKLLPPGKIGIVELRKYLSRVRWDDRVVDQMRVELLLRQSPDETWAGQDDFDGYIAFVYKRSGVVVLDCPVVGNAVYTFGEDWRDLSRRTKQELIAHTHRWGIRRFVHSGDWKNRLIKHIKSPEW